MQKVIITGATGFIGSRLVWECVKNGIKTTLLVRDKGRLAVEFVRHPMIHIVETTIEKATPEIMGGENFDAFFHLGWGGVVPEEKDNVQLQMGNIQMSLTALELANAIGCRKFLVAGSVAEYAFSRGVMDVYRIQTPNDMYGAAKAATHQFLEVRARQLGMPFCWMVLPSTFGEQRTGNNIITYTIRTLLAGGRPLYGDLTQLWDFLYVDEVVRAIRLVGEKGKAGKIYGIGSGQYRPLRSYIEEIRDVIDPRLELGIGERPSLSVKTSSCVNIYELTVDTGFLPQISFGEGIRMMLNAWGGDSGKMRLSYLVCQESRWVA